MFIPALKRSSNAVMFQYVSICFIVSVSCSTFSKFRNSQEVPRQLLIFTAFEWRWLWRCTSEKKRRKRRKRRKSINVGVWHSLAPRQEISSRAELRCFEGNESRSDAASLLRCGKLSVTVCVSLIFFDLWCSDSLMACKIL